MNTNIIWIECLYQLRKNWVLVAAFAMALAILLGGTAAIYILYHPRDLVGPCGVCR